MQSHVETSNDDSIVEGPGRGLMADGNPKGKYVRRGNKGCYENIIERDPDPSLSQKI